MLKQLIAPATMATMFIAAPLMAAQDSGTTDRTQTGDQQGMSANEAGSGETAGATHTFEQLDQNQDGQLDEDELNTWGSTAAGNNEERGESSEKRTERMLEKYDNDDDGSISRDELEQGPKGAGGARGSNL